MKRWIAVVTIGLAFSPVVWAQTVHFNDDNLKAAVKEQLGITHDPTYADMFNLDELDAHYRGITDLTGLEYATNLEDLWLNDNQISDLSPLAGLKRLQVLWLGANRISDLSPLAGLTNLRELYCGDNQVSNLSALAGLTNLAHLQIQGNEISDISPLAGLTNLRWVHLEDNQISDISPLLELKDKTLELVYLEGNPLYPEACTDHIPALEAAGVIVYHDPCIQVKVPNVVGMTQSDAEAALTAVGFKLGQISWGPSNLPEGLVFEQDPAGGQMALLGLAVDLVLSQAGGGPGPGPGPAVPGLVGHWKLDETTGMAADGGQTGRRPAI
jgi:Leucine-rich repeat (LRR) protein